jgi:hypothetical protein
MPFRSVPNGRAFVYSQAATAIFGVFTIALIVLLIYNSTLTMRRDDQLFLDDASSHSVGHIVRLKDVVDNDAECVGPLDMLGELREDNQALVARMIQIHDLCDETNDVATASLLENWIDQTQRRVWFLFETSQTRVPG